VYLAAVLAIFAVWYRLEGTLSFAGITRGRSERFYWAAAIATLALSTAVGDLTADTWHLGNLVSGFMFCGLILPLPARRFLGLSYVAAFWTAYVLTRRLGASFADWMGGPPSAAVWASRPPSSLCCGAWPSSWSACTSS